MKVKKLTPQNAAPVKREVLAVAAVAADGSAIAPASELVRHNHFY